MEAWMHYTPEGLTFLTVENPDFDRLRVNLQGYRKQRVIPLPFISANSLDQDLLHYIQAARDLKVPLYFVFVIPQDQGFFLNGSTIGLYKEALQTFFPLAWDKWAEYTRYFFGYRALSANRSRRPTKALLPALEFCLEDEEPG
jgi:hypothetical protein